MLETSILAAGALLLPCAVWAFTMEQAPVKLDQMRQLACTEKRQHAELIAEALSKAENLTEAEKAQALAAFDCPYCGCALDPKNPPVG